MILPGLFLKPYRGGVLGASGKVVIGDNVFIGMNSIICRNVSIGNNVIIGAGSVVTKNCDANSIYAGNPAKKIGCIEDFIKKRIALQKDEATILAREYYDRYSRIPSKTDMGEYFMLFTKWEDSDDFQSAIDVCENPDKSIEFMKNNAPIYDSFDAFIKDALKL